MVNRDKSKTQSIEDPKKDEGNREASVTPLEGSQEIPNTKVINEARDESNEAEEKSSNGDSKESEAAISDHQRKDQDEGTVALK